MVLFIGLLLIKISAFHVYEHHHAEEEHEEPCELCLLSIDLQQADVLEIWFHGNWEITLPTQYPIKIEFADSQAQSGVLKTDLVSRPPPTPAHLIYFSL